MKPKRAFVKVTFREADGKRLTAQSTRFVAFWRDQFGTLCTTASGDPEAIEALGPKARAIIQRAVDGE